MRGSKSMAKGKGKNKPNGKNKPTTNNVGNAVGGSQNTTANAVAVSTIKADDSQKISKQDYEMFLSLKKALDDNGELDMSKYKAGKEKEIDDEMSLIKQIKEEELEADLKAKRIDLESLCFSF